jgi:hypothetical protein
VYNIKVIFTIYLIKSGGGTGPVKPGNLTVYRQGAKSCGLSER